MHTSYPHILSEMQQFMLNVAEYSELHLGFSGGLDSTVLLHLLANEPACLKKLTATYIDHQLQDESAAWAVHCEAICTQWSVPFNAQTVMLEKTNRQGVEALARKARYHAFYQQLNAGSALLTAHHQRDQAETFLLNLTRGSGVHGLAAMPFKKTIPLPSQKQAFHVRPLLKVPYKELVIYAQTHQLTWVEDSSNQDTQFSRNQIRWQVLPQFEQACPFIQQQIERAASHQSEALSLLNRLAQQDMELGEYGAFSINLLSYQRLDWPSLKNVVRYWAKSQLNIALSYDQLLWIKTYGQDRKGSTASLMMKKGQLRFYRGSLHYIAETMKAYEFNLYDKQPLIKTPLDSKEFNYVVDIPTKWLEKNRDVLTVRNLSDSDAPNVKRLKKWFQKSAVPTWYRRYWPVICKDNQPFLLWGADAIFQNEIFDDFKRATLDCSDTGSQDWVRFVLTQETVMGFATDNDCLK